MLTNQISRSMIGHWLVIGSNERKLKTIHVRPAKLTPDVGNNVLGLLFGMVIDEISLIFINHHQPKLRRRWTDLLQ